jgi:hypothetical protein
MSEQEAEEIRERMRKLRCELDHDVQQIVDSARTMTDWRFYVRSYPLVCMGLAAAAGFLLIPRRQKTFKADADALYKLAQREPLLVQPKASTMGEGVTRSLIRIARNAIVSGIAAYASKRAGSLFDARRPPSDDWSPTGAGAAGSPGMNREPENDF